MASAATLSNPAAAPGPDGVPDNPPYGWLSPRISFSHDLAGDHNLPGSAASPHRSARRAYDDADMDFEFRRLDDPGAMVTAEELFSDGKLLPRQLAPTCPASPPVRSPAPELARQPKVKDEPPASETHAAFSPKAPTCTSQWRELLRRRKAAKNATEAARSEAQKYSSSRYASFSSMAARTVSATSNAAAVPRSLKHLLYRSTRSTSSSAAGGDDRPRLSLDADKPVDAPATQYSSRHRSRTRVVTTDGSVILQQQASEGGRTGRPSARRVPGERSASVDSPRVNSTGKIVFQGLGRSSSSPSSLHGGGAAARGRHRRPDGVRVAPVLNVSASVFGLGQLFGSAPQRRDPSSRSASSAGAVRTGGTGKTDRS